MGKGKQLRGERGWAAVERLLLGLTFGCFAVMSLVIAAVGALRLIDEPGGWRLKALGVLLPGLVITGTAAVLRLSAAGRGQVSRSKRDTIRITSLSVYAGAERDVCRTGGYAACQ